MSHGKIVPSHIYIRCKFLLIGRFLSAKKLLKGSQYGHTTPGSTNHKNGNDTRGIKG